MPVPVQDVALAASPGFDVKRERARRSVALEFFTQHIFTPDPDKDWSVVQKALQVIDYQRPITFGPMPPAPGRLLSLPEKSPLGKGFFREAESKLGAPREEARVAGEWWTISPEAVYMKFFVPTALVDARTDAVQSARYFLPGARNAKGKSVATRERG